MNAVRALDVLYDGACPLCVECSRWLSRRRQRIPLRLVDVHGEIARRTYERVPGDGRALIVIDDTGRTWIGPAAFLMCLWALERWASLVWLAVRRPLRPLTIGLFALVGANRTFVASLLGVPSCENGHRGRTPTHGGPYRSARLTT